MNWNDTGRRVGTVADTSTGMPPEIAGALAYILGIFSGVALLILERRNRFVRFHAMQSILFFGGLMVVSVVSLLVPFLGWALAGLVLPLAGLAGWLWGMYSALTRRWARFPLVGEWADRYSAPVER